MGCEIALAGRESPALGDRFVGMSRAVHEMPATMAALACGDVVERHALEVVLETAVLSLEHRCEVDHRLSVRPAPDGMAYPTLRGPLREVVGAHASLLARARRVVGGQCSDEHPEGRGTGAVAADTALRLLSGRSDGQVQPVEVQLVMTDGSLLGTGDPDASVAEPARIPGTARCRRRTRAAASSVACSVACWSCATTCASPRRCDAPIVQADHTDPACRGGPTASVNGSGACARCNPVKEAPGWRVEVLRGRLPRPRLEPSPPSALETRLTAALDAV